MKRAPLAHHVVVRQLHALGRTGGARRVDEAQHVLRLNGPPGRLEVEAVGAERLELRQGQGALGRIPVDHDQVLEGRHPVEHRQEAIQESLLGHDDAVAGVREQVLDLLGGGGVVYGEAGRADMHGGAVAEVEVGAVDQHEADDVAALHAESIECRRPPAHGFRVFAPAGLEVGVLEAQRRVVRALLGRDLERLAHRGRPERARLLRCCGTGLACRSLHLKPPGRFSPALRR